MLMRDARLRHTRILFVWMLVGMLAALAVPAGSVLAAEAAAPAPAPAATATAPAPTATVAPVAPAAPIASPPAVVPAVPPAAPTSGSPAAGPSLEGTADEAAASGRGDMALPITVATFEIQRDWRSMLHFFSLARFDLAKADAAKVLAAKPTPETVLALVEAPIRATARSSA